MLSKRTTVLILAMVLAVPGAARAQLKAAINDWPAWMGPDRTGVSSFRRSRFALRSGRRNRYPAGFAPTRSLDRHSSRHF